MESESAKMIYPAFLNVFTAPTKPAPGSSAELVLGWQSSNTLPNCTVGAWKPRASLDGEPVFEWCCRSQHCSRRAVGGGRFALRSDYRCYTKVTLNFLTVPRALRQAGNTYEIFQICPQNFRCRAVRRGQCDGLCTNDDQRCRRNLPISDLLKVVR